MMKLQLPRLASLTTSFVISIVSRIFFSVEWPPPKNKPVLSQLCASLGGAIFSILSIQSLTFNILHLFVEIFCIKSGHFLRNLSRFGDSDIVRFDFYHRHYLHYDIRNKNLIGAKQIVDTQILFLRLYGIFGGK